MDIVKFNMLVLCCLFALCACGEIRSPGGVTSASRSGAGPSALVHSEPPVASLSGSFQHQGQTINWSAGLVGPTVAFYHFHGAGGDFHMETLDMPGDQVLSAAEVERNGATDLMIGVVDENDAMTFLRLYDEDGDGVPDTTETLFTSGTEQLFVTDVSMNEHGHAFLLDRRCQDVLVAIDSDGDSWPDAMQSDRFVRSADFPSLLEVVDIYHSTAGAVVGFTRELSPDWITLQEPQAGHQYMDTDSNGVADQEVTLEGPDAPPTFDGHVYAGQDEVGVYAESGDTVELWSIDDDGDPDALLGSAIVSTSDEPTTISLGSSLVLGSRIALWRAGSMTSRSVQQVLESWPQVIEVTPSPVVRGETFSITVRGANLSNQCDVELCTADGTCFTPSFSSSDPDSMEA